MRGEIRKIKPSRQSLALAQGIFQQAVNPFRASPMEPNASVRKCSEIPMVNVIIPTLASVERFHLLQRAVHSIRNSSHRPLQIIAVVNGSRFDTGVCDWLKAQPDIHFEYVEKPSSPNAILRGRELVATEFFSALDDDDEYLPGSTDLKLAKIQADPQLDLVVGNYYQKSDGGEVLRYSQLLNVPASPLEILMEFNWLSSGNALFRTSSVGQTYFHNYHAYAEWTFVAFRLALDGKKVAVVDAPVFRCHEGTPGSLSKSADYFQAYIPLFQRMLDLAPQHYVARLISRKLSAAHHDASVAALERKNRLQALKHHWLSLIHAGGLRYLGYTRHLIK